LILNSFCTRTRTVALSGLSTGGSAAPPRRTVSAEETVDALQSTTYQVRELTIKNRLCSDDVAIEIVFTCEKQTASDSISKSSPTSRARALETRVQ
jgi:hypothetical protein